MPYSVIGTVGVPACYGGFESLVENLIPSDQIALVYCSSKIYAKPKIFNYKNTKLCYIPLNPNGAQSIFYDVFSVLHTLIFTKNNLLILGVSGAFVIPLVRLFSDRKIITNIDGLEWKRPKWSKFARWFLRWSESLAVRYSHSVIVDNKAIDNYVSQTYGVRGVLIEYGGDHAFEQEDVSALSPSQSAYAFALCRIEPENNVDMILAAFSIQRELSLKFVGNWNYSEYGRALKEKYSRFSHIELVDPIYDVMTLARMREGCQVYIHGHSAGGTNPSLVEMMFFGIPIFCFSCDYNRETTECRALYFSDENELSELVKLKAWTDESIGKAMREIAERRYRWEQIREKYLSLLKQ